MSICTLGIYEIYWFYKNWRLIRDERQINISPLLRGIFSPFFYAPLIREINKEVSRTIVYARDSNTGHRPSYINIWIWAPSYFILSILVNIPGPYWAFFFLLATATLIPAVSVIKKLSNHAHER